VPDRARNEARARQLGADHFIDSGRGGWMEQVYRATGDRGADVVLEVIGTGSRSALDRLVSAVDRTGIKPVIDSCYKLPELPAALDRDPFGKVVVTVAA